MSVQFFGWNVIYDDDQHLDAEQEPKQGRLYTMYHGTTVQAAISIIQNGFQRSTDGMLGPGVYVSRNQKKAERYPLNIHSSERVVLTLSVNTGRVKKIDKDNHPLQKTWHSNGYDTAWVPPNCGMKSVPSGLEEDCVYDPNRVEVVRIALAPAAELPKLQALIQQRRTRGVADSQSFGETCRVCKTKMDSAHSVQACWGCGDTICTLMKTHKCRSFC